MRNILIVFSERGDSWIEDASIPITLSLNDWLMEKGFSSFVASGIRDINDPKMIVDGMQIRVKVFH